MPLRRIISYEQQKQLDLDYMSDNTSNATDLFNPLERASLTMKYKLMQNQK